MYNLFPINIEFHFILQDIKSQISQHPTLQSLLKLTQKSTKKLQCINLYSQVQKRDLGLEIEQQNIYTEIKELYKAVSVLRDDPPTEHQIQVITATISQIKEKYEQTFDMLSKQEDILNQEFRHVQMLLNRQQNNNQIKQIKQMDQYQQEMQQQGDNLVGGYDEGLLENPKARIQKLKKEIQQVNKKLLLLNNGKGKWFDTDHRDFIKIYNRCGGSDKRIIAEGMKILGMNQTEIMDHLELYDHYLQLQKEKKIASEEYRQIKFFQEEEKREREEQREEIKRLEEKLKKEKDQQDRVRKHEEIQRYKQKKIQGKQQMVMKYQEEKLKSIKAPPLQPSKKKEILERNRMMLENQQKKIVQARNKRQSVDKGKLQSIERKIKPNVEVKKIDSVKSETKVVVRKSSSVKKQ